MPSSRGGCKSSHSLLSTPGAFSMTPKVPMGPQTCWKSWATVPWRSWIFLVALKFRPLRGRSCGAPVGPIWRKQTSQCAFSCKLGCDVWPVRQTPCFFSSNVKVHCHGCFFYNIWPHWQTKNVKYTVANGRTRKSHLQEEPQQIAVLL